ncbi:MBL fold metallo-hydrolase [Alterisphingorhabdus coralli]|uniref:MBL fold metallo-hydrolase n=1 Tax=Alterisphingorhabdus coralli TaxID=3071408 RepID=A0AA97F5G3_9SPHN|nr:MBL fold metallo-hydrolase [Parasphingorhabdus sp. SCSIO 66989]WOE74664.1 MBL fold metallo-hydrolase [Parasphingorhabdus sp. SCSIO 66989]
MSYAEDSKRYRAKKSKHPIRRLIAFILLILLGVAGYLLYTADPILDRPLRSLAESRLGKVHPYIADNSGLRAFVCGSSSPIATWDRAKTCIGVIADGEILLFDVGAGAIRNIENWGLGAQHISRVFLTHFHSDHLGDLDEANVQGWIWGRREPLHVHGPVGVDRVVKGYNQALGLDYGYRNTYGTERFLPMRGALMLAHAAEPRPGDTVEVYRKGKLVVEAFLVDHSPVEPAFGYRIHYGDRTVLVSGDTRRSATLERLARNADILFHEAQSARLSRLMAEAAARKSDERISYVMSKAGDYHSAAEDFGEIAHNTKVRKLVMYHLAPPPDQWLMQRVFLRGMPGNVLLAEDGLVFTLIPGETGVDQDMIEPL